MSSVTVAAGAHQQPTAVWQRRLAAVLEVLGVCMAGQLIGFLLISVLGVKILNPVAVLEADPNADLLALSQNYALVILFQYLGLLLPALLIGWWHRHRRIRAYGLTTAGQRFTAHLRAGVVLFTVTGLGFNLLRLVDHLIPLGAKAPGQAIIYAALDWSTPAFWVFMAVGSFLLIPPLEELFHRGYVQTRLAEDFDAPTAILMTAFLFAFSHDQYFMTLSVWNIGMLLTSVFEAVAYGYVFYCTKSLLATIVAHVIVNFPVRGIGDVVLIALVLAVTVLARKPIVAEIRTFWAMLTTGIASLTVTALEVVGVTLFMIAYALTGDALVLAGVALLAIALILEFAEKRRLNPHTPAYSAPAG